LDDEVGLVEPDYIDELKFELLGKTGKLTLQLDLTSDATSSALAQALNLSSNYANDFATDITNVSGTKLIADPISNLGLVYEYLETAKAIASQGSTVAAYEELESYILDLTAITVEATALGLEVATKSAEGRGCNAQSNSNSCVNDLADIEEATRQQNALATRSTSDGPSFFTAAQNLWAATLKITYP